MRFIALLPKQSNVLGSCAFRYTRLQLEVKLGGMEIGSNEFIRPMRCIDLLPKGCCAWGNNVACTRKTLHFLLTEICTTHEGRNTEKVGEQLETGC